MEFPRAEFTEKTSKDLEQLVGELESGSSVEVVAAVARQSGSYGELDIIPSVLASWLMMGGLVLSPFVFPDWSLLPAVIVAFAVGWGVSRLSVVRRLLPRARARRQVQEAARSAFMREHLGATKDRTGLLIYLSLREGEVAILPDYGVQALISDAHWNVIVDSARKAPYQTRAQALIEALRPSAKLLAEQLPRSADDQDELSNAVRIVR